MTNTLDKIIHNGDEYEFPSGEVGVSSQANNIFTPWMKIWWGTQSDFNNLTEDSNTAYLILADTPTPPSPWRQPWANTLLYMPMNSTNQATDQSWNNVQTTNSWVTFWTYQWVDCGYFNDSHIQVTPFNIPSTVTVLCRCYCIGRNTSDGKIFDTRSGNDYLVLINWSGWYAQLRPVGNIDSQEQAQNQWVLLASTNDSNGSIVYLKWSNIDNSWTSSYAFTWFDATTMNIGNEHNNAVSRYFLWWLSELIVEGKTWTAQEISDYYDQTKWDYWIS